MSVDLPCHRCGYDLRAHPADGECPECGASVAEANRLAALPARPAWRDSDPRWRRRMLLGTWFLALVPLMDALKVTGLSKDIPVPPVFNICGAVRTLDDTLAADPWVYPPLAFCIGVVLLFSNERGRRPGRLDWTRRWGVACSYVTFLLSAIQVLFLVSLVATGVAAVLQSIALKYQPPVTPTFVSVSTALLRYGPQPAVLAGVSTVAFSSAAMLLACAPLFDALRSAGSKRVAAVLTIPLALLALWHLAQVARYCLQTWGVAWADVFRYGTFFWPGILRILAGVQFVGTVSRAAMAMEAVKWALVLAIALWLSTAQLMAWRRRRKPAA